LLARPQAGEFDPDVAMRHEARKPDEVLGQVDDADLLSHLEHRDPSARFGERRRLDRKSTRLNSSHVSISYAVFCLKKKKNKQYRNHYILTIAPDWREDASSVIGARRRAWCDEQPVQLCVALCDIIDYATVSLSDPP